MAYWSELNQTAAVGGCDSFRAANDIQLAEDAFDVSLYGAFADEKFGTDLFIALAGGDPLQDFDLSSAQCFAADAIGQLGCENRRYAGFATVHRPNAIH
jgi:hypothetical protein